MPSAFLSPLSLTGFCFSGPCFSGPSIPSVSRCVRPRRCRARQVVISASKFESTKPRINYDAYLTPSSSAYGPQADSKYPTGKLPLALEVDFVLNHPITDAVIAALVSLNCLLFALQTIDLSTGLHRAVAAYENNLSVLFIVEYFGRWYGKGLSPRYLLSRGMLIDFLAIAPFGFDVADQSEALFVRILRLSRILRIQRVVMDTDRSSEVMGSMTEIQKQLASIGFSLFSLLYVSAGLFFTFEKDINPNVSNFFDAFYFSTITLFTVGFGDVTPLTSMGRAITVLTVLTGAVLVPYQLSQIEKVRQLTEQRKRASVMDEYKNSSVQLSSAEKRTKMEASKMEDLYPSLSDNTIECKRCFLRGHQTDSRFCRNCGASLEMFNRFK